jgi:hypothetical protein
MNVLLPDAALPAKLILNPDLRVSDDDYYPEHSYCATRWHRVRTQLNMWAMS